MRSSRSETMIAAIAVLAVVLSASIVIGGGQASAEDIDYKIDLGDAGGRVADPSDAVVSVDGAYFSSLDAAVHYAEPGQTIMFVADTWFKSEEEYDCRADGLTIDLNGRTLKIDQYAFVPIGVDFTIKNGTMVTDSGTYVLYVGYDYMDTKGVVLQDLTLDGGLNVCNAEVTLRNVDSIGSKYYAVWGEGNTRIVIESGTYSHTSRSEGVSSYDILALSAKTNPDMRIEGGTFIVDKGKLLHQDTGQDLTIEGGVFKGDGVDADEVNEYVTGGFKLVGSAASGFTAVDGSKVETTEVSGKTSQRVEAGGLTLDVDGLVDGTLDVVVLPTEVSEIQGYGTPAAVYDVIVSGTAWTGEGTITVTVPLSIPDGQRVVSGSVKVFYIPEDGEPEDMGATLTRDGSSVTFSTDHNSEYAVFYDTVEKKSSVFIPDNRADDPVVIPPQQSEDDGDGAETIAVAAACVVALLAIIILLVRSKP